MRLAEMISHAGYTAKTFVFRPEYDASIPEDQRFYEATPSGELRIYVNNPLVIEHYKLGEYYYFDSIPVGEA